MHLNIHTYGLKIRLYDHSHLWWCVCMFASWEHHHLSLVIILTSLPKCCVIFIFSFECVSIYCLNIANQGSSSSQLCVQKLNIPLTQPLCLYSSNNGWCKMFLHFLICVCFVIIIFLIASFQPFYFHSQTRVIWMFNCSFHGGFIIFESIAPR